MNKIEAEVNGKYTSHWIWKKSVKVQGIGGNHMRQLFLKWKISRWS